MQAEEVSLSGGDLLVIREAAQSYIKEQKDESFFHGMWAGLWIAGVGTLAAGAILWGLDVDRAVRMSVLWTADGIVFASLLPSILGFYWEWKRRKDSRRVSQRE